MRHYFSCASCDDYDLLRQIAEVILLYSTINVTVISGTRNLSSFFFLARQPYMGLGLLVSSKFHGHTH
jgi:hypothetical protein